MKTKSPHFRVLFGLKVKQLRQKRQLSFADLSEKTGLSISYLNEIEKGKKFPKEDKVAVMAAALGISVEEILTFDQDENLAPVQELLRSNFLNELPLDLFGIDLNKVVEIIANAPARVGAFISTLLEISRNYALREENFYFGALRSYLELHSNYFADLEQAALAFSREHAIPAGRPLPENLLRRLLADDLGYKISENGLDAYPDLKHLRAVFVPKRNELLLNSSLTASQRSFQYGKELGFHFLGLKDRAYTSSLMRGRVFEEVLNHSKAIYFSVALHMPEQAFVADMQQFFARAEWDSKAWLGLMHRYEATPEMFYHRLTNILPQHFGMRKLFFIRFVHDPRQQVFEVDRELHLNYRHQPHGNGLFEHYCRRWVSVSLLQELADRQAKGEQPDFLVQAQLSQYQKGSETYLCLTIARPDYPSPHRNVSVTLGLLLDDELSRKIKFLADPAIPLREVHTTCERCTISDCQERASPPIIADRRTKMQRIQDQLDALQR
ncbi:MAG: helix-turn-helix domain-containing protein [Lewinellaceae bacterium]|nr:helix-turn-helix domain-containing protein [Lewinellaceae bacterium]